MPSSAIAEPQFVIYVSRPEFPSGFSTDGFLKLPYLHWDSFKNRTIRAAIIDKRRKQGHSRPIDREIAQGKSLERKLIWHYLHSDRPLHSLHCRRTLDQYGYPSLRDTSVRDKDQILYKRTKIDKVDGPVKDSKIRQIFRSPADREYQSAPEDVNAKVLMVDQLWLWILNNGECPWCYQESMIRLYTRSLNLHVSIMLANICCRDRDHVCHCKRGR